MKTIEQIAQAPANRLVSPFPAGDYGLRINEAKTIIIAAITEALEQEQGRWQSSIYDLLCKKTPGENIDGAGCESGDPLDVTLSEVAQAITHFIDALEQERNRTCEWEQEGWKYYAYIPFRTSCGKAGVGKVDANYCSHCGGKIVVKGEKQ